MTLIFSGKESFCPLNIGRSRTCMLLGAFKAVGELFKVGSYAVRESPRMTDAAGPVACSC